MRVFGEPRVLVMLALFALFGATTGLAQNQSGASQKQPSSLNRSPKTVVGCLTGYNGHYTLGTSSDVLYLLAGNAALFKRYNAMLVQATGTVSEPPPDPSKHSDLSQQLPTLTISKLKKVADGCD